MQNDPNDGRKGNQDPLKNVLQMAISNTPANEISRTNESNTVSSLDPERRQFLNNVLDEISSVSVIKIMQSCVVELRQGLKSISEGTATEDTFSDMEDALEKLIDKTGSVDIANDFHKIDGFEVLLPLLKTNHEGVQSGTAELVAELVQNNPYCQHQALYLLSHILELIECNPSNAVKIKGVYALSCLLRQNGAAQDCFEARDGFSMLLRAIQNNVEKLRIKISFLLTSLCNENPHFREILCGMGFVEQLVALLHGEHDLSHEHMLSTLLILVSQYEPARLECQRPELGFRECLERQLAFLDGKEEFIEERDYCQQLMELCFTGTSPETSVADR